MSLIRIPQLKIYISPRKKMEMTKEELIKYFDLFSNTETDGIELFLNEKAHPTVVDVFTNLDREPLNKVRLTQLFIMSGLPGITNDFFKYYWLTIPEKHPYKVHKIEDFDESFIKKEDSPFEIRSCQHFRWGLRRIYTDGLLYYGNISNGFKHLSSKNKTELELFFNKKRFPSEIIMERGHSLKFNKIPVEDRFLISEMACKSYGDVPKTKSEFMDFLIESYREAVVNGRTKVSFKDLLSIERDENGKPIKNAQYPNPSARTKHDSSLLLFQFAGTDLMEIEIDNEKELLEKYSEQADKFISARSNAEKNTELFLSLLNDLDIYVATSMRDKNDFVDMAKTCDDIFHDPKIKNFNLRYFDPTMSAADGHEDKGLIECLMVRCAKMLIYTAGIKDSYGKDAEAAMALSAGKPVIFYCKDSSREKFFKRVHPLSKLIDFSTGVANGAIVTEHLQELIELIRRIFTNDMEYQLKQDRKGYFKLEEILTQSPVRIQTNDRLLTNSFWNYFDRFVKE